MEKAKTPEEAKKAIKHIQSVFAVVGWLSLAFSIVAIAGAKGGWANLILVINVIFSAAIILMGKALDKPYKEKVPKFAQYFSVILLVINIIIKIILRDMTIAGLIYPFVLWIVAKQAGHALAVLKSVEIQSQS